MKNMAKTSGKPSAREDRLTAWITDLFGSLRFLAGCFAFFILYFAWNLGLLGIKPIEHYPFGGLELWVSIFAIFLSVAVLISQHRQRRIEKIREEVEFEINVRAESEITKIWHMLDAIQQKLGIAQPDAELEQMKQSTNLDHLHEQAGRAAKEE